jgi:dolichyl-phosphate beta-glucosyltransferase
MSSATVVVPCYNEGLRLDEDAFVGLTRDGGLNLIFVDDGSRDSTPARLTSLKNRAPERIEVITLEQNSGKAEAVRRGLLRAIDGGASTVGYLDADLATPPSEVLRLVALMGSSDAGILMASRVALLGREIQRRAIRHYLGRIFATSASITLGLPVYDTQCGAKLFRRTPQLEAALAQPFLSQWAFDVELIGRLLVGGPGIPPTALSQFVEEPLKTWRDVAGSKVRFYQMTLAMTDLILIGMDMRRRRAISSLHLVEDDPKRQR